MLLNIYVNRPYTVNSFLGRSIQLKFLKKHQQKMLGHAQKHLYFKGQHSTKQN